MVGSKCKPPLPFLDNSTRDYRKTLTFSISDDPEDSEVSEISFKSEKNKTDDENDDDESNGSPTKKVKAEAMDSAMEYEMR